MGSRRLSARKSNDSFLDGMKAQSEAINAVCSGIAFLNLAAHQINRSIAFQSIPGADAVFRGSFFVEVIPCKAAILRSSWRPSLSHSFS